MKKSLHNKLNLNYNSGIFITVLFFSILVMVQQGWAQPFSATYPFTNVTTSTGLTDPTPVPTAAGVTFGSFTAVGQTAANSSASTRFAFNGQPLGATDLSNTFTGAILLTRYYQVTVTVNPGSTVNLTSISFTFQRSSTAVRQYSVRSDADGYADNLPASISPANAALSVVPVNVFQSTDANTAASNGSFITLSGASFTGLTGGTTRTFRFYGFNAEAAGGTFGIDNVIINGNASSCTIPSPPSITATQSTCQPGCTLGGGSFNINSACGIGTTLTYYTSIAGTTTTSAPVYNQTTPMTIYYACVDNISGCKSAIQTLTTVPGSCPPAPSGASITAIESTCQPGCAVSGGSFNINTSCGAGTTLTYFTDNSGLTTTGAPTYNQTSPMSVYYACVDDVTGCKSTVQTLTTNPGTCITPSTPLITATESSCQPGCILGGGSFNINSSCGTGTTLTYYTDIDGLTTTGAPTYDQSSPMTIFYACVNNTTGCRSAIQTLTTVPGNCTNPSDPLITATESSCLPGCNLGGGSFNINSSCGTGATLTYFTDIDGFTTTGTPTYNQSSPMTIFYACVNNISGCRSTIQTLTTVPGSCPAAPSNPEITATESTCQSGCNLGGGSFNINTSCGVGTTLTYFTNISGVATTGTPTYNQTTPMTIFYACVDDISGCKSSIQTLTTVPGTCINPPNPTVIATESTCQAGCTLGGGSFQFTPTAVGYTLTFFTDISGNTTTGSPTYDQTIPMTIYYANVDNVTGCRSAIQSLTTVPGTCTPPSDPLITTTESTCQSGCTVSGGSFIVNTSCGAGSTLTYYTDITGATTTSTPVYNQTSATTIYYACVDDVTGCASTIQTLTTIPGVCPIPADPSNPQSDSPQCASVGVTINTVGVQPIGETWYWQTISGGTSIDNSGGAYNVNASGTYYIRSQDNSTLCWSSGEGSITIVITPDPVCLNGGTVNAFCGCNCPPGFSGEFCQIAACITPGTPIITATESTCQSGCVVSGGSLNVNTSCGVGTTLTYFTDISGSTSTSAPTYNQTSPITIYYACVDNSNSSCRSAIQTLTTAPGTCTTPSDPLITATESTCQAGCTVGGGSFNVNTSCGAGTTLTYFTDISGTTTTSAPTYNQTSSMTIYYACVDDVTGCRSAIQTLTTVPGVCTNPPSPTITATESTCQAGCLVDGGTFNIAPTAIGYFLTYFTDISGSTTTGAPTYNQTTPMTIYYANVDGITGCRSAIQSLTTIPGNCTTPSDPLITATESTCQAGCTVGGGSFNVNTSCGAGTTLTYFTDISGNTITSTPAYNQTIATTIYYACVDDLTGCRSAIQTLTTVPGTCPTPSDPLITATESTCQSGCTVSGGSFNVNTSCGVGTTLTYFTDISGSTSTSAPTYNQTSPITIYYACVDNSNSSCRSAIQTLTTVPGTCTTPSDPLITATESTCQAGCTVGGGSFNVNTSCGAGTTLTYYTDISGTTTTSAPTYNQASPMTIYYACVDDITGCRSAIQTLTTVPGVCTNPPSPTITATQSTCQAGCLVDGGTFNIAPTAIGYILTYFTDISGNTTTGAPTYNQTTPMTIYYANVDGITGCRSAIQSLTTVPGTCTTPSNPLITATESSCQNGCTVGGGSFNVNTSCGAGTTLTYFTDISGNTTTSTPTYNQTTATTIYYACVDDLTGCRSAIQTLTTVPGTCTTPSNPLITATESSCQAGCVVSGGSFNVNTSCGAGTTLTYFTDISGSTTTSAPTYNQTSSMTIFYACVDDVTGCRSAIQTLTTVPGVCTNPPSPTITATQSTCQAGCLVDGGTFNIAPTAIGYILTYFTDISGNTTTGAPTYNQTTPMTIYYANVDGITGCRSVIQSLTTVPGTCTTPSNPLITATESTCQTGCTVGGGSFNVNTSCGVGTTLTYFTDISGSTTTSSPIYNQTNAMTIYYACVNDLTGCRSAIQTLTTVPGICIPPSAPTITSSTPTTFCSGGSVVLSSDAASGNQWYQGLTLLTAETNQTYTATTNGSYTVTTTNGLCTSTASVAVVVTVNPLPTASINYSLGSYCAPGTASVTQSGQGGGTYTSTSGLMINATTGEINVTTSTPNTYLVTYAFSDGICNDVTTASVTIVTPPFTFYADNDGDGYGSGIAIPACIQPPNTSSVAGDCDDTNFDANPSLTEVCLNGIDDNCDSHIDEGCGCLNPHIALAGNDTTVCNEGNVLLNGAIAGSATSGTWGTTGTGFFTPSIASLNAVYHPSLADYASGSVKLHLTTDATIDCFAGSDTLVVTFVALPANTGVISGITQFCSPGPTSTATYSIVDIGEYSYKWILPTGLTLLSGQGTTTITVGFDLTAIHEGIGGYISVQAQNINGCLSNTPSTLRVTAHLVLPVQPGSISGPDKACPGDIATYSVVSVPRTDIYTWTMPIGVSILSGQNTNIITVQYNGGFIGGTIKVKAGNGCGTSPDRPRAVTLNILPAPTAIIGNANGVCGETIPYTIATPVTGATDYIWTAPAGASFLGGVNTGISVSIIFSGSFTGGNISVAAINNCGNGTARVMNVIGVPGFPSSITGATSFCATQNQTFSVATVTGALTYNWTKTNGLTYVTGQTTKNYTVTFGGPVANQMLTVRAVNGCGQSNARVLSGISVVACPRLSEEISTLHLIAYPNPVADFVKVSFNSSLEQKYTLQLSDATGRVVITEVKTAAYGTNEMELSVKTLSSGMYILHFQMGEQTEQIRLFVE